MHEQHRYGAPSRPRSDDHTVWGGSKPDTVGLIRGSLLLAGLFAIATLLLVMVP